MQAAGSDVANRHIEKIRGEPGNDAGGVMSVLRTAGIEEGDADRATKIEGRAMASTRPLSSHSQKTAMMS
jgi:hypothetical protein